jgi:hypothetical protein
MRDFPPAGAQEFFTPTQTSENILAKTTRSARRERAIIVIVIERIFQ